MRRLPTARQTMLDGVGKIVGNKKPAMQGVPRVYRLRKLQHIEEYNCRLHGTRGCGRSCCRGLDDFLLLNIQMGSHMKKQERKVVVGIGEIIAGDYGLGKHAVRLLHDSQIEKTGVEFVETGTVGSDIERLIEESSHLLVLDAADVGQTPGTIVEFKETNVEQLGELHRLPHQVEFHEILEHAATHDAFPDHVHFIGVQPGNFSPGFELSGEVRAAIPSVLQRATTILHEWEQVS